MSTKTLMIIALILAVHSVFGINLSKSKTNSKIPFSKNLPAHVCIRSTSFRNRNRNHNCNKINYQLKKENRTGLRKFYSREFYQAQKNNQRSK